MELQKLCLDCMEYTRHVMKMNVEIYKQYMTAWNKYWEEMFDNFKKTSA